MLHALTICGLHLPSSPSLYRSCHRSPQWFHTFHPLNILTQPTNVSLKTAVSASICEPKRTARTITTNGLHFIQPRHGHTVHTAVATVHTYSITSNEAFASEHPVTHQSIGVQTFWSRRLWPRVTQYHQRTKATFPNDLCTALWNVITSSTTTHCFHSNMEEPRALK